MNKQNVEELLEYILASEGKDFEEWYCSILDKEIEVIKHPFVEVEQVVNLIEEIEQEKKLWNKFDEVGHIYYNCLILLKDYLND